MQEDNGKLHPGVSSLIYMHIDIFVASPNILATWCFFFFCIWNMVLDNFFFW